MIFRISRKYWSREWFLNKHGRYKAMSWEFSRLFWKRWLGLQIEKVQVEEPQDTIRISVSAECTIGRMHLLIFRSRDKSRSHTHLVPILFFLFLLERPLQKSLRLRRFKWDRDEIWRECSSSKCASIDSRVFDFTSLFRAKSASQRLYSSLAFSSSWPIG